MINPFKHFTLDQMDCPCCGKNWTKVEMMKALDDLQDAHPHKISIISGFRCFDHNKAVGGVRGSQHCLGNAADIRSEDMDALFALCKEKFKAVGDGRSRGFIHIDRRTDRERSWTY